MKLAKVLAAVTAAMICASCVWEVVLPAVTRDAGVSAFATEPAPEPPAPIRLLSGYMPEAATDYTMYLPGAGEPIKAIYVSASHASSSALFEKRMRIALETEVNAIVFDIKETDGVVSFKGIPRADELGVSSDYIKDIKGFIKNMRDNDIYVIGRLVALKDDTITKLFPDFGLRLANGEYFREAPIRVNGKSYPSPTWLNPYNRDVWNYLAELAEGAAMLGFDEIQFDYLRFPSSSKIKDARFGDTGGLSREEIIAEMTGYLADRIRPYGVKVAVDVYGTIVLSDLDASIVGQDFALMAQKLDFICPMPYPSHFAEGSMGVQYPDLDPYQTIYRFMQACSSRLDGVENAATVRTWLQDFSAPWIDHWQDYDAKQVREQVNAVYDAGYDGWMLWSSGGYNSEGGLLRE
ncbi:MAG: putative glycoside hydrolase [Clostridiales bacterium]|nr:putative glycoside hydrolase [Clostridiales bacterium]